MHRAERLRQRVPLREPQRGHRTRGQRPGDESDERGRPPPAAADASARRGADSSAPARWLHAELRRFARSLWASACRVQHGLLLVPSLLAGGSFAGWSVERDSEPSLGESAETREQIQTRSEEQRAALAVPNSELPRSAATRVAVAVATSHASQSGAALCTEPRARTSSAPCARRESVRPDSAPCAKSLPMSALHPRIDAKSAKCARADAMSDSGSRKRADSGDPAAEPTAPIS